MMIAIVGEPISGNERNTEENFNFLVQTTSNGVTAAEIHKVLKGYISGSQSQHHTSTRTKRSRNGSSRLYSFLCFTREEDGTEVTECIPKENDVTLLRAPQPSKAGHSLKSLDFLVKRSIDEQTAKAVLKTVLKAGYSQLQFSTTTPTKQSSWIESSHLIRFSSFATEKDETGEPKYMSQCIDAKLVGAPQSSETRNTRESLDFLVRRSIDEQTEAAVLKTILKNDSKHPKKRGVAIQTEPTDVFEYAADPDVRTRKKKSSLWMRCIGDRKHSFLAPCLCCCND
ncbi:hypothetical protein GE061_019605 [Apolygus lucorum]|uniref:Uncharacterized protein n=1 Tax=Apolygus lucorum TaxID=248454 RepID=A0A6A4JSZ6_APOLU|nr:hypothetical protein GE061_019605 [Apolygus lucorum]